MKVSWKWLSEYVDLSGVGGPQGLADLLTARGLEVEEIASQGQGLEKVVTVRILARDQHPEADRLSLCKVTTGAGEPLEIVCGAQNMKAGDTVALAQVGAHLPNGMKIQAGKIRGVLSNGMLCSEEELKLAEKSEGLLILPEGTPLGRPLGEILGLDDVIFTLKLTANRGDCLSHFGLAREIAAALGKTPCRPEALKTPTDGSPIAIRLEAGEDAPQFYGVSIDGVKVGPSPAWLKRRLEAVGARSINNVVDASNFVMLELGHPVHIYDAERIEGRAIGVRRAKEGERLPLLDGTEITLAGTELTIFDGSGKAIGLAGVMGGGNSEVREGTTCVFLECAEFHPTLVRRASARHVKKTDAAHRFERGIDPENLANVIGRLAKLVIDLAGGKVAGGAVARLREPKRPAIELERGYVQRFLGIADLTDAEVERMIRQQGCELKASAQGWTVTPPSFRLDLRIREDLAEEVARSVGYDRIPATIPQLTGEPTPLLGEPRSAEREALLKAKQELARAGLCETVNYAFNSRAWLAELGFTSTARVINPLSEEHEFLVPSLLPGLVQNALHNWRHHFGSEALPIRLFEIRPTFSVATGADGQPLPVEAKGETETGVCEAWKVAFALSGPRYAGGLRNEQGEVDFFDLRAVLEQLFDRLGTRGVRYQPITQTRSPEQPIVKLLHPGQSVEILAGNKVAGYAGLLHPGVAKRLKTRAPLWVAELDWETLRSLSKTLLDPRAFKPWAEFPPMERDFALVVSESVTADKITQVVLKAGKPLAKVAKIFDVYRGSQVTEGMTSVAVRVIFFEEGRSLQEAETEAASAKILEALQKDLGAQLRS